mmetsp:Transcript_9965/g.25714  ORF Transcript_9965/g.25714 Transcript_9965/m.25714 type:complete len:224 (+) Transcript_9965:805-1476(+)
MLPGLGAGAGGWPVSLVSLPLLLGCPSSSSSSTSSTKPAACASFLFFAAMTAAASCRLRSASKASCAATFAAWAALELGFSQPSGSAILRSLSVRASCSCVSSSERFNLLNFSSSSCTAMLLMNASKLSSAAVAAAPASLSPGGWLPVAVPAPSFSPAGWLLAAAVSAGLLLAASAPPPPPSASGMASLPEGLAFAPEPLRSAWAPSSPSPCMLLPGGGPVLF